MGYKTGNIDLHIHSSASDGSLSPEQILGRAVHYGLAAISITDHDTLEGAVAALAHGIPKNLEFLTGVEISAEFPPGYDASGSMHILGYGITVEDPLLNRMLKKQQQARSRRNPKIIQKLNAIGIKVSLDEIEAEAGKNEIARPHIAACLVKKGYAANVDEAFDRYLGRGKPAYVNKFRVPAKEAIRTISNAGGIAVLAHPALLPGSAAKRLENLVSMLADMGMGGIEAYYPGHDQKQKDLYERIAEKFNLLVTGGTDFHGDINSEISMGSGTGDLAVPFSVFQRLTEALAVKKTENQDRRTEQVMETNLKNPDFSSLEEKLEYRFADRTLLAAALRHRSYVHENPESGTDNERLEFLGDAVLNLIVSHILMELFPNLTEGELSRTRAGLVNEERLAGAASSIRLGDYLLLGKGESRSNGRHKNSILADTFEALVAAVYLDGGFAAAFDLIRTHFSPFFEAVETEENPVYDYKSLLQEHVQSKHLDMPAYEIIAESGPDHNKTFRVALTVNGLRTEGVGKNKKAAEQDAAQKAWQQIKHKNE